MPSRSNAHRRPGDWHGTDGPMDSEMGVPAANDLVLVEMDDGVLELMCVTGRKDLRSAINAVGDVESG
jgi:hypothetical protein